jgi:hypothetical protein
MWSLGTLEDNQHWSRYLSLKVRCSPIVQRFNFLSAPFKWMLAFSVMSDARRSRDRMCHRHPNKSTLEVEYRRFQLIEKVESGSDPNVLRCEWGSDSILDRLSCWRQSQKWGWTNQRLSRREKEDPLTDREITKIERSDNWIIVQDSVPWLDPFRN